MCVFLHGRFAGQGVKYGKGGGRRDLQAGG